MSAYTDYLIYTQDADTVAMLAVGDTIATGRDGHFLILLRSKTVPTIPADAELLATGHCINDCPFAKLAGDALDKYKLAYNTEPYIEVQGGFEEGEEDQEVTITPPFRFGAFQ